MNIVLLRPLVEVSLWDDPDIFASFHGRISRMIKSGIATIESQVFSMLQNVYCFSFSDYRCLELAPEKWSSLKYGIGICATGFVGGHIPNRRFRQSTLRRMTFRWGL